MLKCIIHFFLQNCLTISSGLYKYMYNSWFFFTWEWRGNMCLSVWLEFFVPLVIHMERSPLSVKDCKFWPLFGTFKPTNYNWLVLTREYQLQKSRKKVENVDIVQFVWTVSFWTIWYQVDGTFYVLRCQYPLDAMRRD